MPERFDNIELPPRVKFKKSLMEFTSSLLYTLLILLIYLITLYCGLHLSRLCQSPLLNYTGIGISYLLTSIGIVTSAAIWVVTGEHTIFWNLWHKFLSLPDQQFRVAVGLMIVTALVVRLIVRKIKRWQSFTKAGISLNIASPVFLFTAGFWAIKQGMLSMPYDTALIFSLGFLPFSYLGFWRWRFWRES